jgi:predicted ATPase
MANLRLVKWELTGIRSIGETTEIEIAPITLIGGQNSSGKSSFIKSILLLAQAESGEPTIQEPSLPIDGTLVNLGPDINNLISNFSKGAQGLNSEIAPKIVATLIDDSKDTFYKLSISLREDSIKNIDSIHVLETKYIGRDRGNFDLETSDIGIEQRELTVSNLNDYTELYELLELNEEEQKKVAENQEYLLKYIAGLKSENSEKTDIFAKETERLKIFMEGGSTPAPWTRANYAMRSIVSSEMEEKELKQHSKKDIASVNISKYKNVQERVLEQFPGTFFKSGQPTGFLVSKLFANNNLESIKEYLKNNIRPYGVEGYLEDVLTDWKENIIDGLPFTVYNLPAGEGSHEGYTAFKYHWDREYQTFMREKGYMLTNTNTFNDADRPNMDIVESIQEVYEDIEPINYDKKWSEGEVSEVIDIFNNGTKNWRQYSDIWDENNPTPENWITNLEQDVIMPLDIWTLAERSETDVFSVAKLLIDNNTSLDAVILSLGYVNEHGPSHVEIPEGFLKKMLTRQPMGLPEENIGGPLSWGSIFWEIISYSFLSKSNKKGSTDIKDILAEIIKFISLHTDFSNLAKDEDSSYFYEQIIAGFIIATIPNWPTSNLFDESEVDLTEILESIDTKLFDNKKTYTVSEIAKLTSVGEKTIRAWLRKNFSEEHAKYSHWELTSEQVVKILKKWGTPAGLVKEQQLNKENSSSLEKVLVLDDFHRGPNEIVQKAYGFFNTIKYLGPLRSSNQERRRGRVMEYIPLGRDAEYFFQYYHENQHQVISAVIPIPKINIPKDPDDWEIKTDNLTNLTLSEAANAWFSYFGIAASLQTKPVETGDLYSGEIQPLDLPIGENISTRHIGVGFSQLAPIIVLSLMASVGDTVILEEPESNLHPDAQRMLGEFFVAMEASGKRFIIETHSDHLVNRLRLKVAVINDENSNYFASERIGIFFAEKNEGQTRFKKANINEDGSYDMTDYPTGFFNQATKDALKLLKLRSKKNK